MSSEYFDYLGHSFSENMIEEIKTRKSLRTLGDAVLKTALIENLLNEVDTQGDITLKKSMMENRKALGEVALKLKIKDGEELEGFIGSIYLLHGGFESAKRSIETHILTKINCLNLSKYSNYVGIVQENLAKKELVPEYKYDDKGPHHEKEFKAYLYIDDEQVAEGDWCKDKSSARQNVSEKYYNEFLREL